MIIKNVSLQPQTTTPASPITIAVEFDSVFPWATLRSIHANWQEIKAAYLNWQFGINETLWAGGANMAIQQVRAQVNGVWTVLTLDESTGKYVGTFAAPSVTSYNVNTGHYYPVKIEATNKAGTVTTIDENSATVGDSLKLYVKETTKPTITITAPTAGAFLATGVPAITFQLRDESSGSGVNISTLKLTVDGKEYTSSAMSVTNVTNGYNVTFTPTTALTDGEHTIKVNVSDNDGNAAVEVSRSFTTDTVPPSLSITAPSTNDLWVAASTYTVAGTTNDSLSGIESVTITLNGTDQGAVTIGSNGAFSKAVNLAAGKNTIVVTATDKAGKTSTVTRTINLDTEAPEITAVSINPNPVNVNNSYTISVTLKG